MRHIFATVPAKRLIRASGLAPALAAGAALALGAPIGPFGAAPAKAESIGDSLSAAGQSFQRDAGRVGRAVRGLFTSPDQGPVGPAAEEPTPVDPDTAENGAPFAADRDPEVRAAAGAAARRLGPDATVASIEGVQRPDGPDGPIELRIVLTNNETWDAMLEPGRYGEGTDGWRVSRLTRID